jgi:ferredoxin
MIVIEDKTLCSGCAVSAMCVLRTALPCVKIMRVEYPVVDTTRCVGCDMCIMACPMLNRISRENLREPSVYACKNRNENITLLSSSGGVFSLLAEDVLSQNGVVFGCAFDDQFDVEHRYIRKPDELDGLRRSKYVQSSIEYSYRQTEKALQSGEVVLFSGTPYQIAGLRAYLRREYQNLVYCDVACHGVPSRKVYHRYLGFLKKTYQPEITGITFRSKRRGWSNYGTVVAFRNGETFHSINSIEPLYMRGFLVNYTYGRPVTAAGRYENTYSDITLADYWRIDRKYAWFHDEKGVSLVMVNTVAGEAAFARIESSLYLVETDFSKCT